MPILKIIREFLHTMKEELTVHWLQSVFINKAAVRLYADQAVYVGPGKQPCHSATTEQAAEWSCVSLPWASRNSSNSNISLMGQ